MGNFSVPSCLVFVLGVLFATECVLGAIDDGVEYYMTNYCEGEINITAEADGIVISQSGAQYTANQDCIVTLKSTVESNRVLVTFSILDVDENEDGTCDDSISIYDGDDDTGTVLTADGGLCGKLSNADDVYTSTGDSITIKFVTGATNLGGGFTLAATSFHTGTCDDTTELTCDNGNCISINLKDNLRDNCGDESDENVAIQQTLGLWEKLMDFGLAAAIGIIVAGAVVLIIVVVCVGCCIAKCCCKKVSPV
ncbi:uncharacterized protein [Ptychodera flava]|uniref:uncharacterized protein n=1 Tax=Ptychodera flava TaxID=63121 RepID=UPI00396A068F